MGASKRRAPLYGRQAQQRSILAAARSGPLQSLSDRELAPREHLPTIYPHPQAVMRAWVRSGPEPIRVDAKLMRSTLLAAGIEFRAEERIFGCWVWGSAVTSLK